MLKTYEDINNGMFWNGIPVMTWRAPEGPDARPGDPPEEESGDTLGFYQIKGGMYMVEMLPVLPCALRIVRTTTAHFSTRSSCFRIILKAGPLIPADTWNKSFLSFLSQQMYGPWGWNLMESYMLKRDIGSSWFPLLHGHTSDLKFWKNAGGTQVNPHVTGLCEDRGRLMGTGKWEQQTWTPASSLLTHSRRSMRNMPSSSKWSLHISLES